MYIVKIKGKAKIPDYVQLRDENFTLIAYFRVDRPERALEKCGLGGKIGEILSVVHEMPFGKIQKLTFKMDSNVVIDLTDVSVFQGHSLVLSDVDIKIRRGEFVYLIGQTGSGKSSLLKTLYGELLLEKGTGQIADFDLTKLNQKQVPYLRRKLGIVFQDFQLLTDRSVFDNLHFVLKATGWKNETDMKTRINEVLEEVGIPTKGFKMPHELSGGEQQRVVIARALLNRPEIILADEPTGNLDPKVSDDIMKLLHTISKTDASVFMATHDYRIIQKFPGRILECSGGTVKEISSVSAA